MTHFGGAVEALLAAETDVSGCVRVCRGGGEGGGVKVGTQWGCWAAWGELWGHCWQLSQMSVLGLGGGGVRGGADCGGQSNAA